MEKLIYDLVTDKITEEEFYKLYPIDIRSNDDYFYNILLKAIDKRDLDLIEVCLDVIEYLSDDEYIDDKLCSVYKELISTDWVSYTLLERLLDSLEIKKENRKYYINTLKTNKFKEGDISNIHSFMVPIWSKCLWNLFKTNETSETLIILNRYLDSPYEELRNTAKTLIQKIENK